MPSEKSDAEEGDEEEAPPVARPWCGICMVEIMKGKSTCERV